MIGDIPFFNLSGYRLECQIALTRELSLMNVRNALFPCELPGVGAPLTAQIHDSYSQALARFFPAYCYTDPIFSVRSGSLGPEAPIGMRAFPIGQSGASTHFV